MSELLKRLRERLRAKAARNPQGALQYAQEYDRLHGTNLAKQLLQPESAPAQNQPDTLNPVAEASHSRKMESPAEPKRKHRRRKRSAN